MNRDVIINKHTALDPYTSNIVLDVKFNITKLYDILSSAYEINNCVLTNLPYFNLYEQVKYDDTLYACILDKVFNIFNRYKIFTDGYIDDYSEVYYRVKQIDLNRSLSAVKYITNNFFDFTLSKILYTNLSNPFEIYDIYHAQVGEKQFLNKCIEKHIVRITDLMNTAVIKPKFANTSSIAIILKAYKFYKKTEVKFDTTNIFNILTENKACFNDEEFLERCISILPFTHTENKILCDRVNYLKAKQFLNELKD